VIKIDARGLPVATLADSAKTRVGEFAIAIGAPFSLDYSVTFGHVSAKGRSGILDGSEGGGMDQDFIQTDAMINPGSSGGPLANIEGEVIGINTLIRGLRTGIGFAIPSTLAREVADQLIAEGKFTRAWLGVGIQGLDENPAFRELVQGVKEGVVVARILPDGPAAKSDLKPIDVITAVDGKPVSTPQQLRDAIRGKTIGQPVTLNVFRQGKTIHVKVSPSEWAEPGLTVASTRSAPPRESESAELGISVQALTPELAGQLGVESTEGVLVTAVTKDSPASRKDLRAGDIITSINQQPTTSPAEFKEAIKHVNLRKGVLINLVSSKTARFEILKQTEP
jgi:serine protease Do